MMTADEWLGYTTCHWGRNGKVEVKRSEMLAFYTERCQAASKRPVADVAERYGFSVHAVDAVLKHARAMGVELPRWRAMMNSATTTLADYLDIDTDILRDACKKTGTKIVRAR